MLDKVPGNDDVKGSAEIEILSVTLKNVKSAHLEIGHTCSIKIQANNFL